MERLVLMGRCGTRRALRAEVPTGTTAPAKAYPSSRPRPRWRRDSPRSCGTVRLEIARLLDARIARCWVQRRLEVCMTSLMLMRRSIRKVTLIGASAASCLRVVWLKVKYPALMIDFGTVIRSGCDIGCVDDATMRLHRADIARGVTIRAESGAHLEIVESGIGPHSVITAVRSLSIASGCALAEMVVVRDQDHVMRSGARFRHGDFISEPVRIGERVWIGAKATILKGVRSATRP